MDWSPPSSSVHGISQARILEQVAVSFSKGSSGTRDWTCFSCIGMRILYHWATKEAQTSLRHWLHWKFYICELNSLKYSFFPCLQGINNAYHVLMKQLIHLSENGEIQEATDMQYQCSLTISTMASPSVPGRPSMPQEERLSGYWVRQTSGQWDLYISTLFRISNSQKMKKTHFLPLRSLQGRTLPSTNYMKTDSEES